MKRCLGGEDVSKKKELETGVEQGKELCRLGSEAELGLV